MSAHPPKNFPPAHVWLGHVQFSNDERYLSHSNQSRWKAVESKTEETMVWLDQVREDLGTFEPLKIKPLIEGDGQDFAWKPTL